MHPDWAATNGRDRWLLLATTRLADGISPQLVLFKAAGESPQAGFNLSMLLGDALVLSAEWSGGQRPKQVLEAALQSSGRPVDPSSLPRSWQDRAAVGLTWTGIRKLSVLAEFEYNAAAPARQEWNTLRNGPPQTFLLYQRWVQEAQELPTRRALFLNAVWQDAILPGVDVNLMFRRDLVDRSAFGWMELRNRSSGQSEFALQLQRTMGSARTALGAAPVRQSLLFVARCYF